MRRGSRRPSIRCQSAKLSPNSLHPEQPSLRP